MISFSAALHRVAATTPLPREKETVPLERACGRVLAEAPRADLDQPAFDRVTMDGYAVRSLDLAGPGTLHCVGTLTAGQRSRQVLAPGECLEIMTGAPLPEGADAVVPVERSRRAGDQVTFEVGTVARANVHARGRDLREGEAPLPVGTAILPARLPLLATLGRRSVEVFRRPRVAVLASGDELVDPSVRPVGGQIRESNRFALAAQIESAGAECTILPPVRDDPDALLASLRTALAADVVLLTGGSSMGIKDYTGEVVSALGASKHFDRVRIKPGKPVLYFTLGEQQIFGLPGNPVSAFVTFEVLVRPVLERRAGRIDAWPRPIRLPLAEALAAPAERRLLQIAVWEPGVDGDHVRPLRWSGSGDLVTLSRANALVELAEGVRVDAGAEVSVRPIGSFLDPTPRGSEPFAEGDEIR